MRARATKGERLVRLTGIYNASGTLLGEISYWIGAKLGKRHCELCKITHASVRQKPEWKTVKSKLPIPFETLHLNERSPELAALTEKSPLCGGLDREWPFYFAG